MRAVIINKKTTTIKFIENQDAYCIPENDDEFIWVDSLTKDKEVERDVLSQNFNISQLAIDDAQRDRHPPKFEGFSEYNFLLIKAFDAETNSIDYNILHISFFVCDHFLITVHNGSSPSIEDEWSELSNNQLRDVSNPYSLLYLILKKIVKRYTTVIFSLESRLDKIEDSMIENPTDELLGELIRYSTKTQYLHRIFNNQDIVIKEMLKSDSSIDANELKHKFIDIQEHMERLAGLTGLLNEVIKSLIEGYISVSGHKLNQIMKTLTIAAVIFLPLTFIAGIYGMNFENIPELKFKNGYFFAIGAMSVLAVGLLILFRKLKWL